MIVPFWKAMLVALTPWRRERLMDSLGWLTFLVVLVWFYRIPPWLWATHLPEIADGLEALWQISFWRDAVLRGKFDLVSLSGMYPLGVHQMTVAHAGLGLLLLPIALIAGSAVAVNVGFVIGLVLCFLGARFFLRQLITSSFFASIGATIFTFALGRTLHIHTHVNVSLASAFGVWMAGFLLRLRQHPHSRCAWGDAGLAGLAWSVSIIAQPYSLFLCIVLLLLLGAQWKAWKFVPVTTAIAFVVSGPVLLLLLQGRTYLSLLGPSLPEIVFYRSRLGCFVGWSGLSPWQFLRERLAACSEPHLQNWGILVLMLAAIGSVIAWRARFVRVLLIVLLSAMILALGPVWPDSPIAGDLTRTVNDFLWKVGKQTKPFLFDEYSETLKETGVPLPPILLVLFVPSYESARVSGRYSIWVGLAAVALSSLALQRLPQRWAIAIGLLWVLELLPVSRLPLSLPTEPHPAHRWAADQLRGRDFAVYSPPGIASIYSHYLAGDLHATSTIGPFLPSYIRYTHPWIEFRHTVADPPSEVLTDPTHVAILRRAQVGIVLLRLRVAELAKQNNALRFIECFKPGPNVRHYYPYTLCAFEVLPGDDFFSIQPVSGFSVFEPGLVWIEGRQAKAGWRTSQPAAQVIEITLRAFCPSDGRQSVVISLNGRPLSSHFWEGNCWERWSTLLTVSPEMLNAGWNVIEFEAATAYQPYLLIPNSGDRRYLSVAVERLRVSPASRVARWER